MRNGISRTALPAIAAGALIGAAGCGGEGEGEVETTAMEAADASRQGSATTQPGGRPDAPADTAGQPPATPEEMPSLERVRQALAGAPVNPGLTRSDLLEKARAWVEENAEGLSPREAELRAQILAMFEELMDAEELSLAQAKALSESQLLGLWGMDADGDGRLTEEEAVAGMGRMMEMDELTQAYFKDRFDTDGDGEVSPEEAQAGRELMIENQMPLMDTMIERASLVAWDRNADGVLSEAELAEGEAGLNFQDFDGNGEIEGVERMSGYQPLLYEMGQSMTLLEQPDPQALQAQIQEETAAIREELMPAESDFDLDGDGELGEVEREAFSQARSDAIRRIQERSMEAVQNQAARFTMAQFDIAVDRLDANADGLLMNEEWEAGYGDLRVERERKLFRYLYDADRDGRVSDPEVARFMDSYEKQSPYADADLNGRVEPGDLRHFLDRVGAQ